MFDFGNFMFSRRTVVAIALILIALLSIFVVSKVVTSQEFNAKTVESLDDKKVTVLKLSVSAATVSTAMSLIPGDAAMPIANQLAQLTSYFIVILGAILLEKMLLSVIGYVSFTYIIPFACLLGISYLYMRKDTLRDLAIKLAIFGIIIFLAVPASIKISDLVYESHQASIE
ncbi:MAG: hypothetical protein NUK57_04455 [Gudongella sp.]|nr:hypothetical protein [Gudongella sp.]